MGLACLVVTGMSDRSPVAGKRERREGKAREEPLVLDLLLWKGNWSPAHRLAKLSTLSWVLRDISKIIANV